MTMPIFNAVMVAKAPRSFPIADVNAAYDTVVAQIQKYPASIARYSELKEALEGAIRGSVFEEDVNMTPDMWEVREPILAGADDTPRAIPQPKPASKPVAICQELAAGTLPLSAAFHVANTACDFVPETLIDAICSLQQIKPANIVESRKRERALGYLHKALADRQAERMAAGAYGA